MRGRKYWLQVVAVVFLVPGTLHAGNGNAKISFKLSHGYAVVVRGSIGGLEKLNFVIDTGAVPSVVDRRIADKLRLSGTPESFSLFSQNIEVQRVVLPSLQLGPLRVESVQVGESQTERRRPWSKTT